MPSNTYQFSTKQGHMGYGLFIDKRPNNVTDVFTCPCQGNRFKTYEGWKRHVNMGCHKNFRLQKCIDIVLKMIRKLKPLIEFLKPKLSYDVPSDHSNSVNDRTKYIIPMLDDYIKRTEVMLHDYLR